MACTLLRNTAMFMVPVSRPSNLRVCTQPMDISKPLHLRVLNLATLASIFQLPILKATIFKVSTLNKTQITALGAFRFLCMDTTLKASKSHRLRFFHHKSHKTLHIYGQT